MAAGMDISNPCLPDILDLEGMLAVEFSLIDKLLIDNIRQVSQELLGAVAVS